MRKAGYSLLEIMVVLGVVLTAMAVTLPMAASGIEDSRFAGFAAELTGHLGMARRYAQIAETSVALVFDEEPRARYHCSVAVARDRWQRFAESAWPDAGDRAIRNRLPPFALPHPTQDRTLQEPLSSTHRPRVVFGPRGASSATVVFSDGKSRALCAVISAQTGRFRVYLWKSGARRWVRYY